MRYILRRYVPPFTRILLVESGSRHIFEKVIPHLYETHGRRLVIDLVTCYAGIPAGLNPKTSTVYRVTDYPGQPGRKRLYRQLKATRYPILGIICSAEPIMTKWKWMLALLLPAKLFIVNENGDYLWFDRGHWKIIRHFFLYRLGLTGGGAVRTLAQLVFFPLTLLYLLLYAAAVHLRRKLHA